ncbi:hypothetical protein MACJ_001819 [Theileria orientalis]|uniref:Uncharacterized protein n=1 Tax=Theileria orientalis TaxID=68886 RepID=A0A976M527_THEOR|nr:hypothetical protein MACJ_001819 [Theileria orientalis]
MLRSHSQPLISHKKHTFISNRNFPRDKYSSLRSNTLFNTEKDLESEIQELYSGLKDKKWSFSDLRNRLTNEGITLKGCNKPDDVIRRVAQLSLLGKDELERYLQDNDPDFLYEFDNVHDSLKSEYENLSNKDRKGFISSLVNTLKKYDSTLPEDYKDDDVIELTARVRAKNKFEFKLPPRSSNFGANTVEAYMDEAKALLDAYEKAKDDEFLKKHFTDEVKDELNQLNVGYSDCKSDEELVNRLAYSRVVPKLTKRPKRKMGRSSKFFKNSPLQSSFTIQGGDFGDLGKLFEAGTDNIFDNFDFGNDFFDPFNFNGLSIFKDLAPLLGLDPNRLSQLQFESSEQDADNDSYDSGHKDKRHGDETHELRDDDRDTHVETDPSLISLQHKAVDTGDPRIQNMINKAIKDPTLRSVLLTATTKGYEQAREIWNGNVKAMYILEKLNEKHILS